MATETRNFPPAKGEDIRNQPDYMAYRQDLPDTTSADSNRGAIKVGGTLGALEVVVKAYEDIALTGDLTIKLRESSDNVTFADIAGATITITNPAQLAGVEVKRFALERNVKMYVKAVITTDATPTTGALNIYPAKYGR